jgi:hypothetical protein
VIYDGEARDPGEGVEVFEFMLGIGAHEPHGFADFAGCPADYFAAVFAPPSPQGSMLGRSCGAPRALRGRRRRCRSTRTRRVTCARGGSARRTGTAPRSRSASRLASTRRARACPSCRLSCARRISTQRSTRASARRRRCAVRLQRTYARATSTSSCSVASAGEGAMSPMQLTYPHPTPIQIVACSGHLNGSNCARSPSAPHTITVCRARISFFVTALMLLKGCVSFHFLGLCPFAPQPHMGHEPPTARSSTSCPPLQARQRGANRKGLRQCPRPRCRKSRRLHAPGAIDAKCVAPASTSSAVR